MRGFGAVLCVFVCSWFFVLGGVECLVVFDIFVIIIVTFVRVGIANLSSNGSRDIGSVCAGARRELLLSEYCWIVGDV